MTAPAGAASGGAARHASVTRERTVAPFAALVAVRLPGPTGGGVSEAAGRRVVWTCRLTDGAVAWEVRDRPAVAPDCPVAAPVRLAEVEPDVLAGGDDAALTRA